MNLLFFLGFLAFSSLTEASSNAFFTFEDYQDWMDTRDDGMPMAPAYLLPFWPNFRSNNRQEMLSDPLQDLTKGYDVVTIKTKV